MSFECVTILSFVPPARRHSAAGALAFDLFHPFANSLFDAFTRRPVIHAIAQVVGQALHVGDFGLKVVRVLVSVPVPQPLHQPRRRIAQVQRHRFCRGAFDILLHFAVRRVQRVGLGSD